MDTGSNEPKRRFLRYLEVVTGSLEDKRRWWRYKARVKDLPEDYRMAVEAMERYLMHFGPGDGADAASMFEDLADLFEQSVADGTSIREVFGQDPVEFVEAFVQNYSVGRYISRERERFTSAIERAAGESTGREDGTV
jgi:DNA-binding ferritin-like protein (Dps family)